NNRFIIGEIVLAELAEALEQELANGRWVIGRSHARPCHQAIAPEHVTKAILGFGYSIGVEDQYVFRLHFNHRLPVRRSLYQPNRQPLDTTIPVTSVLIQPLPAFSVRVVPQWRQVPGARECCLACVSKNSQDHRSCVLASRDSTMERLVQFSHKLCLIPGINVLSHNLMKQLCRTANLRAVAAHIRQNDPRQYSLAAYRQVMDVPAILAFCRLG